MCLDHLCKSNFISEHVRVRVLFTCVFVVRVQFIAHAIASHQSTRVLIEQLVLLRRVPMTTWMSLGTLSLSVIEPKLHEMNHVTCHVRTLD